ncbi:putative cytochrome protein B [Toxoplasma gondii GT1]|uniref:Putative cytochrome protein B n=1 Tax=Toxoplasma gondii (strain ATCC 50853 / GT1) TaxID=507601 RepID=S7VYP4_TOXGG|nr:putative cytochrome protein B [Toxoplasma gondii GT1]
MTRLAWNVFVDDSGVPQLSTGAQLGLKTATHHKQVLSGNVYSGLYSHLVFYRCALNLNSSYNFAFLVVMTFVLQIITGITPAFKYTSEASCAFAPTFIYKLNWMNVFYDWSSFVFLCILIHMTRGLYNCSYSYLTTPWMSGLNLLCCYVNQISFIFLGKRLPNHRYRLVVHNCVFECGQGQIDTSGRLPFVPSTTVECLLE